MRNVLFAASAVAALVMPGAASAQYYSAADVYAPPPAAYVAPAPSPYAPPPAVVGAPMVQSQVYLAPGTVYDDQAIYMNGQRYYRDCWWDWGRRRCDLKPWW